MSEEKSRPIIVLLHEIYGVNAFMDSVKGTYEAQGYEVMCPNLLGRESFSYEDEALAYKYYMGEIGLNQALDQVKQLLLGQQTQQRQVLLIGYSVGATLAWLCSTEPQVCGVIGYYGSRIRDYTELSPACPVLLFLAEQESSFEPAVLQQQLACKERVAVSMMNGGHGYADPYSLHYNEELAVQSQELAERWMEERIAE
ncbi:dienelactone hydrolase family protein [Paenibacillus sp. GCM10023252]|uniref:dienelactone hydrolase family protein n=1 Tax=Paenibacillus sp. GCM10023252 TaxID=3252649 RepID=UPI00361FA5F6